jgi:hypothetical protein
LVSVQSGSRAPVANLVGHIRLKKIHHDRSVDNFEPICGSGRVTKLQKRTCFLEAIAGLDESTLLCLSTSSGSNPIE